MVSGPPGLALALMVAGSVALLTLVIAKLWPKTSDAPERVGGTILKAWHRFAGMDGSTIPPSKP